MRLWQLDIMSGVFRVNGRERDLVRRGRQTSTDRRPGKSAQTEHFILAGHSRDDGPNGPSVRPLTFGNL